MPDEFDGLVQHVADGVEGIVVAIRSGNTTTPNFIACRLRVAFGELLF